MELRRIRNKKGDATDMVLLLIILFFLAVSFIVALFVNDKLKEIIDTTALNESAAYQDITDAFDKMNSTTVQRGFVLFFGLLVVGIMASSFLIRVHPIFIFIYILTLSAAIFVAVFLANTYQIIIETPQLAAIASQQGMINFIMQNIIKILVGVGAMSMIIIFSKIFTRPAGGSGVGDL